MKLMKRVNCFQSMYSLSQSKTPLLEKLDMSKYLTMSYQIESHPVGPEKSFVPATSHGFESRCGSNRPNHPVMQRTSVNDY